MKVNWLQPYVRCAVLVLTVGCIESAQLDISLAQEMPCTGFNPERKSFDAVGPRADDREGACPDGYAYFAAIPIRRPELVGAPVWGNCCKLPQGALLPQHVYASKQCPDQSVVTGYRLTTTSRQTTFELRCTNIDGARYRLGKAAPAAHVGITRSYLQDLIPSREVSIPRAALPAGIRFAVGRLNINQWSTSACVGQPAGTLLTASGGDDCRGLSFAPLLYTASHEDPVHTVAPCQAVSDIYSASPVCSW